MDNQNDSVEIEINTDTIIELPANLFRKEINSNTLIIAKDIGSWIVLFNDHQRYIFDLISKKISVGKIAKIVNDSKWEDFNFVVAQIFDRKFNKRKLILNELSLKGMYIYLTNKCNLNCKHCYMFSGRKNNKELTANIWKKIIKNFKDFGGKSITFTGGELLMYNDWFEVISYTKEQGLSVTILSNGTLWTQEIIKKAAKYVDEIQISIDGISEETNAMVRGTGYFDSAIQTAVLFAQQNVRTKIATTPTMDNLLLIKKGYINFAKRIQKKLGGAILYILKLRKNYWRDEM